MFAILLDLPLPTRDRNNSDYVRYKNRYVYTANYEYE